VPIFISYRLHSTDLPRQLMQLCIRSSLSLFSLSLALFLSTLFPCGQVLDESHYVKQRGSQRSELLSKGVLRTAKRLVLLSGTPALARPVELYPQVMDARGPPATSIATEERVVLTS